MAGELYTLHRYRPDGTAAPRAEGLRLAKARELIGMSLFDNRQASKAGAQAFARSVVPGHRTAHQGGYSYLIERT